MRRTINPSVFSSRQNQTIKVRRTPIPAASSSTSSTPSVASTPAYSQTNLPVDPAYDLTVGALGHTRDDTLLSLRDQRNAGLSDYGYTANESPTGEVTGLAFDPANPNSRAALLQKHYQQSRRGAQNASAAAGHRWSGSYLNAQKAQDDSYQVSEDSLRKGLLAFLASNRVAQGKAGTDYETGVGAAFGDRVARAGSNPLYSPTPAADGSPAPTTAIDLSKWIKTTYTNANGHPVRVMGDGSKQVLVNGQWKRV